jgi:hypothetical protein
MMKLVKESIPVYIGQTSLYSDGSLYYLILSYSSLGYICKKNGGNGPVYSETLVFLADELGNTVDRIPILEEKGIRDHRRLVERIP